MKYLLFISSFLLFFLLLSPSLAETPSRVSEACRSVSRTEPSVPYDYCVNTLRKAAKRFDDPSSVALPVIAAEDAVSLALKIQSRIGFHDRRRGEGEYLTEEEQAQREGFARLQDYNAEVRRQLDLVLERIRERRYGKAKEALSVATDAYEQCLKIYEENKFVNKIGGLKLERVHFPRVLKILNAVISLFGREREKEKDGMGERMERDGMNRSILDERKKKKRAIRWGRGGQSTLKNLEFFILISELNFYNLKLTKRLKRIAKREK